MTMSTFRIRSEMSRIAEAPGKVWFWELAAAVIDADRCVQCGACVAACPTDSIGLGSDDLPKLVKMCTGCSLCWDFCPRGGLRYEATWLPEEAAQPPEEQLPTPLDGWKASKLGRVEEQLAARVRPGSPFEAAGVQDGGVVTAILLAALEAGEIDGAVVARPDPVHLRKAVPYVATTPEELKEATGSFYNQTMALAALDLAKVGLPADARVAVVGTPCVIQGVKALQARQWRRGASRVDAVALTIALLCTKSFDYERLMVGEIATKRGVDLAEVTKVDVIRGRMLVQGRDGSTLVDEPVKDFHSAALKGCDECADFLGRSADISVGSVGSPDGLSSVLVRSEAGLKALALARHELEVHEIDAPEALEKLDALDHRVASGALQRPLEPDGSLFVEFEEHCAFYGGTDRAPVWR